MRARILFLTVAALSLSRVPLGGLFLYLFLEDSVKAQTASILVLLLALASDLLDGRLARNWGVTSLTGYALDGLGDRAIYMACLLAFAARLHLPHLAAYAIILRDIALYAARSVLPRWDAEIETTRRYTKLNAFLLRLVLGAYLLWHYIFLYGLTTSERYRIGLLVLHIAAVLYTVVAVALLVLLFRIYALSRKKDNLRDA